MTAMIPASHFPPTSLPFFAASTWSNGCCVVQMSTVAGPESGDFEAVVASNGRTIREPSTAPLPDKLAPSSGSSSSRVALWTTLLLVALALGAVGVRAMSGLKPNTDKFVFHTARRGTLLVTVTERGNLESQQNVKVFCEVDDINGDGLEGTAILEIVPNGTQVNKGDLLVQLDQAGHLDRLDAQVLATENAKAAQLQAQISYENIQTQAETLEEEAKLQVEIAKLQLQMFIHKENGTNALEADEINRQIDATENEILAAKASLQLIENEKKGTEELFKLGYAGKSEVDKVRLDYLQAQSTLSAKINTLETQLATLEKKTDFEYRMSQMQFQGDVNTAIRELEQTRRNNTAEIAKAKVALDAAVRQFDKESERLERYRDQLAKCEIRAPESGMVAYATPSRSSRTSTIAEGALLRERQHILSLPNLTTMQVKTSVHESVQNKIEEGLTATIRIDAFPDRAYSGTVKSVGVLPDQGSWHSGDTKMYETYVTIDEAVEQIKPGMTAMVEIQIDRVAERDHRSGAGRQSEGKVHLSFCRAKRSGGQAGDRSRRNKRKVCGSSNRRGRERPGRTQSARGHG